MSGIKASRKESRRKIVLPDLVALDFDGVICDSAGEGFLSAWSVYCQFWQHGTVMTPPPGLAKAFRQLRPVIETGWEFVILIRLLEEKVPEEQIVQGFQEEWCPRILRTYGLQVEEISQRFDRVRDEWIAADLPGWLRSQHFYPGVANRLNQMLSGKIPLFVITTKEGRFAAKLLEQHGVSLPLNQVLGKEQQQPKREILRRVSHQTGISYTHLWFVEDRLKTLRSVEEESDLEPVKLYLASWGYNTPTEREEASQDPRIRVLSLAQFCSDFVAWNPQN
jgi:phosphoglycolate phosphatase-like HAD superfamily hydrolase